MILHDYRCVNGHVEEHYVKSAELTRVCHCGEKSVRVILSAAKLDYGSMAMGESAGTTAIDKFEKMHKDQRKREERFAKEHGDYYNRAPGG
jgi:hypothetical protein